MRLWRASNKRIRNRSSLFAVCCTPTGFDIVYTGVNFQERPTSFSLAEKKAIFVHGCFWHRHEGCSRCTTPKTRTTFWLEKFHANVERDRQKLAELSALGWSPMVIWECETTNPKHLADRLKRFLSP